MLEIGDRSGASACPACGTELAPGLLNCPACRRLVHAERLKALADEAQQAERAGDPTAALVAWRAALELLPATTRQFATIAGRIAELGLRIDVPPAATPPLAPAGEDSTAARTGAGAVGGLGALALALWKFKFLALMLGAKAKFLLLGLTKASTFFSMFLALGVYWAAFGWKFALGLVVSIYIHEMGHVAALLRYGFRAGAPLFLPGVGAVIRLQQTMTDPRQDARVGLAGPLYGLGAALAAFGVFLATGWPAWAAIARLGAWINLFNLTPIWQLDGGRAFRSLTRPQRWLATAALAAAWSLTAEGLLVLMMLVAVFRTLTDAPADRPDRGALVLYIALVGALAALTLIPVSLPA